jgi:hypothetical protein
MDRLEQYIKENINSFDAELPPSGSRARFMARLEAEKARNKVVRLRHVWMSAAVSAAAVVAALVAFSYSGADKDIERSILAMNSQEAQVIALVEKVCPQEMDVVMSSIRSITVEAIPITDQLPDELPEKERIRIIKDYYGRKIEALQDIMACYDVNR